MYTFHGESRNGESIYFTLLKNRLWIAMLNLPLDKSVDGRADNISRWQISFWKKKYLNCPLIRIQVKESEYPGNRAACPEAVRKASSDPGEKNQSVSPRVAEVFCIWKSVLARGGGEQKWWENASSFRMLDGVCASPHGTSWAVRAAVFRAGFTVGATPQNPKTCLWEPVTGEPCQGLLHGQCQIISGVCK